MEPIELPPVIANHLQRMAPRRANDIMLGLHTYHNDEDLQAGLARHPELLHQQIQDISAGYDLALLLHQLQDPGTFLHGEPLRTPLVHMVQEWCHVVGRRCIITQKNRDWWIMSVTRVGAPPFAVAESVTDSPA